MKFGVLSCLKPLSATYKDLVNVGDAIQTIATERFIRNQFNYKDDFVYVERDVDLVDCVGLKDVNLVVNGWFSPIYSGTTFKNPNVEYSLASIYLASFNGQPMGEAVQRIFKNKDEIVGCRDYTTYQILKTNGFRRVYPAFCPTLFLDKRTHVDNDNVYVVDSDADLTKMVFGRRKVITFKNTIKPTPETTWQDIMKLTEERYNEIRDNASLVISTRLHVYFPCLAMGIPTLYTIEKNQWKRRLWIIDHVRENNIDDIRCLGKQAFLNNINHVYDEKLTKELVKLK